ncbi:protein FAM13A isoform X2 [Toxorhynchites rutilus septentrionalis]|nr:protein FAM13A isoform X2 [Toxorhynchites rutilus septentrionalis]XP_055618964.1 protein FAM13A isoform X2 [Toxorhynchites rutilus septentrionalis]XP_055618965.1 protein FAM13A isoform X2 [Toxorhynchites rutilus septentrionalis]XP_055618966.1 protein FAM13A isoform X2 [Toxorhynchites rutilus septentrionalis]XP_055618967.1 protein FAM13A isoform X2 [Toxorhynchites rutilus septentrionalis]
MRRPSSGQNEDDLSRLTTVISPTTGSLSSAQTEHEEGENSSGKNNHIISSILQQHSNIGSNIDGSNNGAGSCSKGNSGTTTGPSTSQYLPNLINSSEWQNCRKRKERQDSTSSISQDRKLIRSNSEEHLPNCQEVIRRVSSHEDFKKPPPLIEISVDKENIIEESAEEQQQLEEQQIFEKNLKNSSENLRKFFIGSESLCAASRDTFEDQNNKPVDQGHGQNHHHHHHHHHHSYSNHLSHNNNHTKNRLSPCRDILKARKDSDSELDGEHERRRHCERFSKTRPPPGRKSVSPRNRSKQSKHTSSGKEKSGNEHFYSKHDSHHSFKHERRGYGKRDKSSEHKTPEPEIFSDYNDNNVLEKGTPDSPREKQLPWDQSFQDDTPVVCQRFADHNFEHANKMGTFGEVRSLPPNATMKHYGNYRSAELHQTIQKPIPQANNMFDDRIKATNRKLSGLKKKLIQYEDRFERENGYRPAHGDKTSDSSIRAVIVEIHKLRKEKNQIKAELSVVNAKMAKGSSTLAATAAEHAMDESKLMNMKETIADIEKRLHEKRATDHRSDNLDSLSSEQLSEEKASVQRALLYLESIYGRPASREERDAARPLYDRYRMIKRLVNRANSISGPCGGNSQMPTILEHEALAIVGTTTPSTDISPPSATSMVQSPTDTSVASTAAQSTDESETTSSSITENIHSMTIEQLWEHYDAAREEKKELRRTIKDFEQKFEETTGRKMLKSDRKTIEETYALYKQKKAKLRLIDALFKKQMSI